MLWFRYKGSPLKKKIKRDKIALERKESKLLTMVSKKVKREIGYNALTKTSLCLLEKSVDTIKRQAQNVYSHSEDLNWFPNYFAIFFMHYRFTKRSVFTVATHPQFFIYVVLSVVLFV